MRKQRRYLYDQENTSRNKNELAHSNDHYNTVEAYPSAEKISLFSREQIKVSSIEPPHLERFLSPQNLKRVDKKIDLSELKIIRPAHERLTPEHQPAVSYTAAQSPANRQTNPLSSLNQRHFMSPSLKSTTQRSIATDYTRVLSPNSNQPYAEWLNSNNQGEFGDFTTVLQANMVQKYSA